MSKGEFALLPLLRRRFPIEPSGDKGHGATLVDEIESGDEVRMVAGVGDRKWRTLRTHDVDLDVRGALPEVVKPLADDDEGVDVGEARRKVRSRRRVGESVAVDLRDVEDLCWPRVHALLGLIVC